MSEPIERTKSASVTRFILALCFLIQFLFFLIPFSYERLLSEYLGIVPVYLVREPISFSYTLITSMFVHGGWGHLGMNMLFLWVVGRPVEHVLGDKYFSILYGLSGIIAGLIQVLSDPLSSIPIIGASGAISGIFGAYAVMFSSSHVPSTKVGGVLISGKFLRLVWFFSTWTFVQLMVGTVLEQKVGGGIAIWAHIGGFTAGLILSELFLKVTRRNG